MLESDRRVELVPGSTALLKRAKVLSRARPDKASSLCDCISFEVMRERGLTEALMGARRFEQAGFVALLKPDE